MVNPDFALRLVSSTSPQSPLLAAQMLELWCYGHAQGILLVGEPANVTEQQPVLRDKEEGQGVP